MSNSKNKRIKGSSTKSSKTGKSANSQTPKKTKKDAPPLRIDSTIELAWGLSMNFSHETTQNTVGKSFLDWIKTLRDAYEGDDHTQDYIDNLAAILSAYLRTSAFERDVSVSYLDTYKDQRAAKIKNVNDIANLASLSSGSVLSKAAAFLGIGSLAGIIDSLTHATKATPGLPFNLNIVLLGGLAGLVIIVLGFRLTQDRLIGKYDKECYMKQLQIWKSKAKPLDILELCNLADRVVALAMKFYPNYHDEDNFIGEPLQTLLTIILPQDDLYKFAENDNKKINDQQTNNVKAEKSVTAKLFDNLQEEQNQGQKTQKTPE